LNFWKYFIRVFIGKSIKQLVHLQADVRTD